MILFNDAVRMQAGRSVIVPDIEVEPVGFRITQVFVNVKARLAKLSVCVVYSKTVVFFREFSKSLCRFIGKFIRYTVRSKCLGSIVCIINFFVSLFGRYKLGYMNVNSGFIIYLPDIGILLHR